MGSILLGSWSMKRGLILWSNGVGNLRDAWKNWLESSCTVEAGRNQKRSSCPGVLGAKGQDIGIDAAVKPPC